jgi:hypothetical protein
MAMAVIIIIHLNGIDRRLEAGEVYHIEEDIKIRSTELLSVALVQGEEIQGDRQKKKLRTLYPFKTKQRTDLIMCTRPYVYRAGCWLSAGIMFYSDITHSSLFISTFSWKLETYLQTEYYNLLDYRVLLIGNLLPKFRQISLLLYLWSSKKKKKKKKEKKEDFSLLFT